MNLLVIYFLLVELCTCAAQVQKKKTDPNDNKGNTPFFLQDPRDNTCLGPNGFTVCDERALWILTRRANRKTTYSLVSFLNPSKQGNCLERKSGFLGLTKTDNVGLGFCSTDGSKSWEFEFIDKTNVKLSINQMCLVRGKKKFKNSVSLQSCKKGEFLPMVYHPAEVHTAGFFLKAADGTCFDGSKFRSCEGQGANRILWGVGVKYIWGKGNRYIFNFHPDDRHSCLVAKGNKIEKGSCQSAGAYSWAFRDGELSYDNGKLCLARLIDNTAELTRCNGGTSEYITMDLPVVYTAEDLEYMLKNQVCIALMLYCCVNVLTDSID